MPTSQESFLEYYNSELEYLRNSGKEFAKAHPNTARKLDYSGHESSDPHTERLLESFAYLSARLHQVIDDKFPEISSALLSVLYPHLMNPMPSMSVVRFSQDQTKKSPSGQVVSPKTPLFTYSTEGIVCRFQTVYPVVIHPIQITQAELVLRSAYSISSEAEWLLKLSFEVEGAFSDLDVEDLIVHIDGSRNQMLGLYDAIFAQKTEGIYISFDGKQALLMPKDSLLPMGFNRDELLIPEPPHTTHAYALLQEYFHFAIKFFFFKICNLNKFKGQGVHSTSFDILIPITSPEKIIRSELCASNFLLFCTPIVNLFPKITDPFRLTNQKMFYRLIPDQRYQNTTEVYSINGVFLVEEGSGTTKEICPYFSFQTGDESLFWAFKRVSAERNVPGSDVCLSFVDLNFNPRDISNNVIFAKTLCTNRFLATELSSGSQLQMEEGASPAAITCLRKPINPTYPPLDGQALWSFISQLSSNYLGLFSSSGDSLPILKKLLKLFAGPEHKERFYEIDHLHKLEVAKCVRRIGREAWRGFVEGLTINLFLHNPQLTGNSGVLLALVLRHYFSLHVSANHFVEMALYDSVTTREIMRWESLPGGNSFL